MYDAIVLVYYMEMPQAKAAELMGIRLEVLHSLLHRAKKWIKKKYGTEYEEMEPGRLRAKPNVYCSMYKEKVYKEQWCR